MRVLHVISALGKGGRERRMVQVAISLSKIPNIEQEILVFTSEIDYHEIDKYNIPIFNVGNTRYSMSKGLYGHLCSKRPDIVHVWTEIPIVLILLSFFKFLFQYKFVVGFLADGNPIKLLMEKLSSIISFICADAIISNSKIGLNAKGAPRNKSHVIYNGFDTNRFKNIEVDKESFIQKLNIDLAVSHMICMIARFNVSKDYELFMSVADKIGKLRDDVLFLAVGDGETLDEIRNKHIYYPNANVLFLGRRNDVERILLHCDISVLFTNEKMHAEGLSNSILESMAAGVPVIATEGGGTPEIIDDQVNGFIIPSGDAEAAVSYILKLLDQEEYRKKIGKLAKTKILTSFIQDGKVAEYIQVYNKILR